MTVALPGRTCWRRAHANRIAFLVDAASYFAALEDALLRAERSVWIVGWDFHGRTRLRPDGGGGRDGELASFLIRILSRRSALEIHVLEWDYSLLYALERGVLARFGDARLEKSDRMHFRFDDCHPFGASQHQKLVVIDDRLAFAGGLDLTLRRWDTPEHAVETPLRVDPDGVAYGPFHDVQIAVDGDAARALGDLARERWRRLTGQEARETAREGDPWPPALVPDAYDAPIAIARTQPPLGEQAGVREVEALLLAAIGAAQHTIYIESQYLTSSSVAAALCLRLRRRDCPEIALVLPRHCASWIEESTMGRLRVGVLRRLRASDLHGRLRALAPVLPGGAFLNVHSKLTIVDDTFLRIGSANLSNRSLGFDSECDLALEAEGRLDLRAAISRLRSRLLSEHLGVPSGAVDAELARHGSLFRALDSLSAGERTLAPLEQGAGERASAWLRVMPVDPRRGRSAALAFGRLWRAARRAVRRRLHGASARPAIERR